MAQTGEEHRDKLERIASRMMLERGLLAEFSPEVCAELVRIPAPATARDDEVRDLRDLPWASIDNDDSLDLDQLTCAEAMLGYRVKVFVAIADVDGLVKDGSAIDGHAHHNTTSVYTPAKIFPMLPEKLSTNLTSLGLNEDRLAIVIEMVVDPDGSIQQSYISRAWVRNRAKLSYHAIGEWLEAGGSVPAGVSAVPGLDDNLRMQDRVAQRLRALRHAHGALDLETVKGKPVFENGRLRGFSVEKKNRAQDLIENFMIAANGVTVHYLSSRNFPFLRRVVKTPKRWARIIELAREHGFQLSDTPDSADLEKFLMKEKADDPQRFPDLSLSIIKLLGPGEYAAEFPGDESNGHFGLAVRDYAHSTAPNRRYPDLVTQRMLKAAMAYQPVPYEMNELEACAKHCTKQEDEAKKVERQVEKSAAALLLESRIGDYFDAIVTGAAPKGTWIRILYPPVEGRLVHGFEDADVGHRIKVQLISTDVDRGFIDFKRVYR